MTLNELMIHDLGSPKCNQLEQYGVIWNYGTDPFWKVGSILLEASSPHQEGTQPTSADEQRWDRSQDLHLLLPGSQQPLPSGQRKHGHTKVTGFTGKMIYKWLMFRIISIYIYNYLYR